MGDQINTKNDICSFFEIFGKYKGLYIAYALLFSLLAIKVIPQDLILAIAVAIFVIAPLNVTEYLYVFSLPWATVAVFSFGITLSLIQSVVFVFKVLFLKGRLKFGALEALIFAFLFVLSIANFFNSSSLTGLSFVFYFIIATYYNNEYVEGSSDKKGSIKHNFSFLLLTILISTLIASGYGFIAGTSINRWVHGIGYASQFCGTLGTTRFGMYLCISMIYPLFFAKDKIAKIICLIVLSMLILATISMTALLLLGGIYLYYYLLRQRTFTKKIATLLILLVLVLLLVVLWGNIREIEFIKPVVTRVEIIINQFIAGDYDAATSGRTDLSSIYFNEFNKSSIFNKVFGSATLSLVETTYSHNSYIDMLRYFGILGLILMFVLQLKRFIDLKEHIFKAPIILLKLLILLVGATVSVFSMQYWQFWLFL